MIIGELDDRHPQQVRETEPPERRPAPPRVDTDAARAQEAQKAFQTTVYEHQYTGKGGLLSIWV